MDMISILNRRIQRDRQALRHLSDAIWQHPELSWHEHFAVREATSYLRNAGFEPVTPCFGVETAFRAESGRGGPAFAVFAEYDALPEVGHGCGHNLICAAALGAFRAVAEELKAQNLPGRIVLLGSPAEESGGGKISLIEGGCLNGIDAAMMVHPSYRATPDVGSTSIVRFDVIFHGRSAHAAGAPELGINALSAVHLLFAGVNAYREHIPEGARMHGIITNGGDAPNITPALASCRFFLRAVDEEWIETMTKRFLDIVRGAELMTGAKAEIRPFNKPYMSRKPNAELNRVYLEGLSELGMKYVVPGTGGRGSSDFGNVSHAVPGIHPYFPVADRKIPGHSEEFREASGTELAFDNAMIAAAAMANTAFRYITDPGFKADVDRDFQER